MIDKLEQIKIVPVVAIDSAEKAEPLADALCAGGLPCAEVTMRTDAALDVIKVMSRRAELLLGVGTVHNPDQAQAAIDAGAKFVVSPGFNPRTVNWCVENKIPVFPGTSSPTDLEMALEHGLDVVKFFPAETIGGVKTLKAFSGPYGGMRFIPTGGIGPGNVKDYLALPCVLSCGGSWMVKPDLLKAGRFDEVQRLAVEAVALAADAAAAPPLTVNTPLPG
ncbi:MAG: 2-dehydro-3-deoxyphosphogluconate aldolase [Verrucomicrobiales bacterium]|nr:2-dehydro-3-deoxyphosphogluconate aldolase [Verrucomicrobiales bacterium]|tara:strand:- start:2798 stop:3460 length:663 start_codon:yes stop_codon:yes gene_type:complete